MSKARCLFFVKLYVHALCRQALLTRFTSSPPHHYPAAFNLLVLCVCVMRAAAPPLRRYFIEPGDDAWQAPHAAWLADLEAWLVGIGCRSDLLGRQVHAQDKLAHYARACTDVTFKFPFGEQVGAGTHQTNRSFKCSGV